MEESMKLSKVTLVMRGYTYKQVKCVADVLCESKFVKNIEVTCNTDDAYQIIKKISDEYQDRLNVGAGTVTDMRKLKMAHDSGATFVLSPTVMDADMLSYCKEHRIVSIPGAFSPSEIYKMHHMGANIIKVFPSNEVSPSYAFKVKEPLEYVALMAVGGVNTQNINEYLDGGYDYIGTAGGIFNKEDIVNCDKEGLLGSLKAFESVIK